VCAECTFNGPPERLKQAERELGKRLLRPGDLILDHREQVGPGDLRMIKAWADTSDGDSPRAEAEHRQRAEAIGLKDCLRRIEQLQKELEREREARERLLDLAGEYEAQWGSDYLAQKWGLKERAAAIRAALAKELRPAK